jgi:hypothetical protein
VDVPYVPGPASMPSPPNYATPTPPSRKRKRMAAWKVLIIALSLIAVGLVPSLMAVDYLGRGKVCSVVAPGGSLEPPPGKQVDIEEAEAAIELFRMYGRLVLFNGDLRKASHGLADDLENMLVVIEPLEGKSDAEMWAALPSIMNVAGSADLHARKMQKECGFQVRGLGS